MLNLSKEQHEKIDRLLDAKVKPRLGILDGRLVKFVKERAAKAAEKLEKSAPLTADTVRKSLEVLRAMQFRKR